MDKSFFIYLEQLELMVFFSGYPLIYLFIRALAEIKFIKGMFKINISTLLPYSYALAGTLFLGLELSSLYPDFSFEHIKLSSAAPFLKLWGLFSIFFLLPRLARRPVLSLLHSLFFFFLLVKDIFLNIFQNTEDNTLKNDMLVYTYSLLLNFAAFLFIVLLYLLYTRFKKGGSSQHA
jgi:hypothetical protein